MKATEPNQVGSFDKKENWQDFMLQCDTVAQAASNNQ